MIGGYRSFGGEGGKVYGWAGEEDVRWRELFMRHGSLSRYGWCLKCELWRQ